MEQPPPEWIIEIFADQNSVRDIVRGILHTIFFHRFFPNILPQTRDVIGMDLPYVSEAEIETLIDQRVAALARQLEMERNQPHHPNHHSAGASGSGRGQVTVQFFEKQRRKAWFNMRGEDEVCWENWTVKVTVAEPRTEAERAKVRSATEKTLRNSVFKIMTLVNSHKDHIPPITTSGANNPFPFQISVNPNQKAPEAEPAGWATRMGIY
ncbi:hypothetical protein OQA88_180 [Cercophora sp. LCS_1]